MEQVFTPIVLDILDECQCSTSIHVHYVHYSVLQVIHSFSTNFKSDVVFYILKNSVLLATLSISLFYLLLQYLELPLPLHSLYLYKIIKILKLINHSFAKEYVSKNQDVYEMHEYIKNIFYL